MIRSTEILFENRKGPKSFGSGGEVIGRYAAPLLESPLPWTRMRRVYALLGVVRRAPPNVCTIALAADMLDVHRLNRRHRPPASSHPAGFSDGAFIH